MRRGLWIRYFVCLLIFSPAGSSPIHSSAIACQKGQLSYGVLDRIENNVAVILIEKNHQQLLIPHHELPEDSQENTWLKVCCKGTGYKFAIDENRTAMETERAKKLMNKLRKHK